MHYLGAIITFLSQSANNVILCILLEKLTHRNPRVSDKFSKKHDYHHPGSFFYISKRQIILLA
jgi:hypothetical protein